MSPKARIVPHLRSLVKDRHEPPVPLVRVGAVPGGADVAPGPPAVACCIAPALDVGVAPCAEGVLQGAVLAEEGVTHGVVALGGVGGAVVVVCWGGVGTWVVRHVLVLVGPFFGDVAVVVFEVWWMRC